MPSDSDNIFLGFSARKPRNPRTTTPPAQTPSRNPFRSLPTSERAHSPLGVVPPPPASSPFTPPHGPAAPGDLSGAITLLMQVLSGTSVTTPEAKERDNVRAPDQFDGSTPENLRTFLTQLELVFKARPRTFDSDEKRVTYALSYLKGTALQWFEPYLLEEPSDQPPVFMSDFRAFRDELWQNFGPYDATGDAEHDLQSLRMDNSDRISSYITEFNRLATQVRWGTSALRYQFYLGLPDRLKDAISLAGKPDSLYMLRVLAQSLDKRYWERKAEQLRDFASPGPTPGTSDFGSETDLSDTESTGSNPRTSTPNPPSPLPSFSDLEEAETPEFRALTPDLAVWDPPREEPLDDASGLAPEAPEDPPSESEL